MMQAQFPSCRGAAVWLVSTDDSWNITGGRVFDPTTRVVFDAASRDPENPAAMSLMWDNATEDNEVAHTLGIIRPSPESVPVQPVCNLCTWMY